MLLRTISAAAAALVAITPGAALAHPYDEVVQGAYITLAPGQARLELDLTPGPAVSAVIMQGLDPKASRRITDAQARAFAQQVLSQSTIALDGAPAAWRVQSVSVPDYDSLKLQADTLKIYAVAVRADRPGHHTLAYDNRYAPAKSECIANIFLQPGGGWRYQVAGQKHSDDGRALTVSYVVAK